MRCAPVLLLAAALVAAPAAAAPKPDDAPAFVAEKDRPAPDGRAVRVLLAQNDIETSVDVGRVAADYAGGLLDALIISAMDNKKQVMTTNQRTKAYETVRPLHIALASFDVEGLALATTQTALSRPEWFRPLPFALTREDTPAAKAAFVTDATTPQLATVTYRYDLSPDFTQIRVIADIDLARRPVAKRGTPAVAATDYFHQRITSIVQLRKRSLDQAGNVASWAADDGRLARDALTRAFGQVERLIPYALALGPADIKSFTDKNREKAYAAGLYGTLIERSTDASGGVLIWSRGLVYIQQTP